jgi:predicted Zn-ribbon and HTH transcriptional regulator
MPAETFIALWVVACLGALLALAIGSEFRRRRVRVEVSEDQVFRCGKCGAVYTDDPEVERSRCPQCGKTNEAFEF